MFLEFDRPLASNQFISIVILAYMRPDHTRQLLESIHAYADMPFEIIVNEDASPRNIRDELYDMHELASTCIFNTGINMGFSASANKAVSLANSDYILFLNNDTLFTRPCLKQLKEVLDTPYLGTATTSMQMTDALLEHVLLVKVGQHVLGLGPNPQAPGYFAFRKERWVETGGFPQVYNNGGDISFIYSLLQRGYFSATFFQDGPDCIRNIDREEKFINSTGQASPYDQSYPHIFGISDADYKRASLERKDRRYPLSHSQYLKEYGIHNIGSWNKYFGDAKIDNVRYDWNKLSKFGQSKWQPLVDTHIEAYHG